MSKEMNWAACPQDCILCLLRKNVKVLAGVTSVRIGKQSNIWPKTAKVRGCDHEQALSMMTGLQSGLLATQTMGWSRDLVSHFVIRSCRAWFFLVDSLANKKNRQERLSQRHSPAQILTYNVKFVFPWSSLLNLQPSADLRCPKTLL